MRLFADEHLAALIPAPLLKTYSVLPTATTSRCVLDPILNYGVASLRD